MMDQSVGYGSRKPSHQRMNLVFLGDSRGRHSLTPCVSGGSFDYECLAQGGAAIGSTEI